MEKVKIKKISKKMKKKIAKIVMVEYSIGMTIPVAQYANITPRIVVKAFGPEEALNYISPHMNRLWKEYYMVNERAVQPAPVPVVTIKPVVKASAPVNKPSEPVATSAATVVEVPASPTSNSSVIKATNAINSCKSIEALEMIKNQVEISVKIEEEEKPALLKMIADKNLELTIDTVGKDEK
jgi:hypothetical protein